MKLYEIKENYLKLLNMDLDDQTLQDTLESLDADLEEKADNIACLIKSLEAEKEAIKNEVDGLMLRMTQKQVKADKLKQYLFDTFKALNKEKIETSRNVLQVKKNPPSVVLDEDFLNWASQNKPELTRIKVEADKTAIKEILKNEELPFARLEVKERLVIK